MPQGGASIHMPKLEALRIPLASDFDVKKYGQSFLNCSQNHQNILQVAKDLKDGLKNAEVEAHVDEQYSYFVPRCQQAEILSFGVIFKYIFMKNPSYSHQRVSEIAEKLAQHSTSLFAALIRIGRDEDIYSLADEGVTDKDLPLERESSGTRNAQCFTKRNGEVIKSIQYWGSQHVKKFGKAQFGFIAPIFTPGQQENYDDNVILPFIKPDGEIEEDPAYGGYSQVFRKAIHPSHHEFWDKSTPQGHTKLVAIKRLNSADPADFEHEYDILTRLGSRNPSNPHQAHLVKLLGTYNHRKQNHLIFHWATSNLKGFWDGIPHPNFNEMVFWMLKQLTGIAGALKLIHHFQPTMPLDFKGNTNQRNVLLSVKNNEKFFGRHGDIKPENFLYFNRSPDTDDPKGVVQISDFGLGRFHGRDSRSAISPTTAQATPTYEPPECQLRQAVSRKYDIWSLGCVYLEFLTWILKGSVEVNNFSEFRGQKNSLGIDEDKYFEIFPTEDGSNRARVKTSVIDWVETLRASKHCSMLIHSLLRIIMHDMLVVDQDKRIASDQLYKKLNELVEECQDAKFMLEPADSDISVPPRIQSPRRGSATWPPVGPHLVVTPADNH